MDGSHPRRFGKWVLYKLSCNKMKPVENIN